MVNKDVHLYRLISRHTVSQQRHSLHHVGQYVYLLIALGYEAQTCNWQSNSTGCLSHWNGVGTSVSAMGHFVTLRLTTLESDLTLIVVKLHACNVPSHFNKKYCVDFIHNLFLFLRGLAEYCIVLPTIEDCRVKHLDSSSRFAGHIRWSALLMDRRQLDHTIRIGFCCVFSFDLFVFKARDEVLP